jgi:DNA-binding MarR family transcriptional regulator
MAAESTEFETNARDRGKALSAPLLVELMSKRGNLPFEFTHNVRDTCLCLHAQQVARALARRFDEALRPVELTNGQFSLLISLNRAKAPRIGDVSALLAMDRTTLTANLKPLERRGLVKVTPDETDKRSRLLTLTPAGRALLVAAAPLWKRAHAETERLISADADALRRAARALLRTGKAIE